MDSIKEALEKLKGLDFEVKHNLGVAPRKDPQIIRDLESKISRCTDRKLKPFLEEELRIESDGQEEFVEYFKAYRRFEGMGWESLEMPYMLGSFKPEKGTYILVFNARLPELLTQTDIPELRGRADISLIKPDRQELINNIVQVVKSDLKISESVQLGISSFYLMAPFNLHTSSTNLTEAHNELIDAMGKFGYRNGEVYKNPKNILV